MVITTMETINYLLMNLTLILMVNQSITGMVLLWEQSQCEKALSLSRNIPALKAFQQVDNKKLLSLFKILVSNQRLRMEKFTKHMP